MDLSASQTREQLTALLVDRATLCAWSVGSALYGIALCLMHVFRTADIHEVLPPIPATLLVWVMAAVDVISNANAEVPAVARIVPARRPGVGDGAVVPGAVPAAEVPQPDGATGPRPPGHLRVAYAVLPNDRATVAGDGVPDRSARARRRAAASVAAPWRRRWTRAASIAAGASSGTVSGSGNTRRLSSRIAVVCRSTACAMAGSTRDGGAARRCASRARRQPSDGAGHTPGAVARGAGAAAAAVAVAGHAFTGADARMCTTPSPRSSRFRTRPRDDQPATDPIPAPTGDAVTAVTAVTQDAGTQ